MCIIDTRIVQSEGTWGNVSFVELSSNCLDPAAQFRFLDSGAMLNLKRPGCLFPTYKAGLGYNLDTFYLYVNSKGLDTEACRERPDRNTDPAITQTPWGGLSIKYTTSKTGTPPTMCIVPKTDQRLVNNPGIDPYIDFTRDCTDAEDKRFNFGKFLRNFRFVPIDMCHACATRYMSLLHVLVNTAGKRLRMRKCLKILRGSSILFLTTIHLNC